MLDLADYLAQEAHANVQECQSLALTPVIHFTPDQSHCPTCGQRLQVYKTTSCRRVVTLAHGEFRAVELVRYCRHQTRPKGRSPPGRIPVVSH